jgi:hypothetical protein
MKGFERSMKESKAFSCKYAFPSKGILAILINNFSSGELIAR